ncbi:MAG TPA: RNA polymerase sigma factor, partial [Nocardioides sp.]|nr:RNA polymerase sigma factor [Nocardioides sp.]
MSSNPRKPVPAEVLSHPAVVALIEGGTPSGTVTSDAIRQASEDASVEPRNLKSLMAHLSGLGISVDLPPSSHQAAAAKSTRRTATASTTPAAKKAATKSTAKAAAKPPATKRTTAATTAKKTATKATAKPAAKTAKTAAKKAPVKKADAKATPAEQVVAAAVGPDGKKILPDIPDEQFEKDVKVDPTIVEDEKQATFIVSDADDAGEPEQQVMVA